MTDAYAISLSMTDLAHHHTGLMLHKKPYRRRVGVVTTEATPDRVRSVDKWVGCYLAVTGIAGGLRWDIGFVF